MSEKHYIGAEELLQDSFRLALEIYKSGFRPDFIVGVWRGGSPVGIAVQEILHVCGIHTDHIAIRTSYYQGIGQPGSEVRVHGLDYLVDNINADDSLLIVDDVFDSGLSIQAILESLRHRARRNMPTQLRIAMPWFKPDNNQTNLRPDYFLHESDKWLVFPHELDGLSREEILANKPELRDIYREYDL